MDFLEDLLDFGDRKRRNRGGIFQNGDHHDDDDHHDDHEHHQNQGSIYPQVSMNSPLPGNQPSSTVSAASLPGVVCRNCSTQTVKGAKFCHGCGTAIDVIQTCASCGSKLPPRALFCAQCGYKNG